MAKSPMNRSSALMATGASFAWRLHASSQGWGQTRPQTAGNGLRSVIDLPGQLVGLLRGAAVGLGLRDRREPAADVGAARAGAEAGRLLGDVAGPERADLTPGLAARLDDRLLDVLEQRHGIHPLPRGRRRGVANECAPGGHGRTHDVVREAGADRRARAPAGPPPRV